MLEIRDINVHFGVIHALKGISLTVDDGEIERLRRQRRGQDHDVHTASGIKKATSGSFGGTGRT